MSGDEIDADAERIVIVGITVECLLLAKLLVYLVAYGCWNLKQEG